MSELTIARERLRDFVAAVFSKAGVPEDEAALIGESLTEADLTGVESHGVSRVPIYLKRIELGVVNAVARLDVLADLPGALDYDRWRVGESLPRGCLQEARVRFDGVHRPSLAQVMQN